MMRVPAVPAATSTRLVPELSRAQVHEHAYMQITLCGSQRQTETSAFPFPELFVGSHTAAHHSPSNTFGCGPPVSALLLLNSSPMATKPSMFRFRVTDRSVYNIDVNSVSASVALHAAREFYRLIRGREIVVEGLGVRAELDERKLRFAELLENESGRSKRRPVARSSHFRAKMLRDGAESSAGRTKRATPRSGETSAP